MKKPVVLWILAIIITLLSVFYQRLTGPTHPERGSVEINGENIKYRLLRTHETIANAEMDIIVSDSSAIGLLKWKRFKSRDNWQIDTIRNINDIITISIPKQPAAGKVVYKVTLVDGKGNLYPLSNEPVIIRFKGHVPAIFLWPHIILMFAGMLLATRTGLEVIAKLDNGFRLALWSTVLLGAGGLIFGPIVQKYAFGEFWTGWPLGHDLTDSKTAFAMIFWLIALWRSKGKYPGRGRVWIIIASLITLAIYLIPHSVWGSELDYTKME